MRLHPPMSPTRSGMPTLAGVDNPGYEPHPVTLAIAHPLACKGTTC